MKKALLILSVIFLAAACSQAPSINSAQQNKQIQSVHIQQTIEDGKQNQNLKFSYQVSDNKTALDVLKSASLVDTKNYSGIGEFVVSINGVKPDSKHFWEFFVNGKSSNVGAGSYRVKDGDALGWKLDPIGNSQ